MTWARVCGLIAFLGLVVFVVGVSAFPPGDTEGAFILFGLFIMIPLGAVIAFYFRFFKG
jgi:uncharacterized membrane protein